MNGLEAINERILAEAQEKADRIIEQARLQCAEILATAQLEKDLLQTVAQESAARQSEAILKRAHSAAALDSRRTILQARQDQLDKVMARALELLCQLSTADKLSFYQNLLTETAADAGEITLSAADQPLGPTLLKSLNGRFTLSGQVGNFIGGLVLKNGSVEDNLTFERLIAVNRPQLIKLADDIMTGAVATTL